MFLTFDDIVFRVPLTTAAVDSEGPIAGVLVHVPLQTRAAALLHEDGVDADVKVVALHVGIILPVDAIAGGGTWRRGFGGCSGRGDRAPCCAGGRGY